MSSPTASATSGSGSFDHRSNATPEPHRHVADGVGNQLFVQLERLRRSGPDPMRVTLFTVMRIHMVASLFATLMTGTPSSPMVNGSHVQVGSACNSRSVTPAWPT